MKSFVHILLSALIFLQSVSVQPQDLWQMDDFIEHVQMHIKEGNSMVEFFKMHYGNQSKEHLPQDKEHGKLPFQHHHDMPSQVIIVQKTGTQLPNTPVFCEGTSNFFYLNLYAYFNFKSLIKPPIA